MTVVGSAMSFLDIAGPNEFFSGTYNGGPQQGLQGQIVGGWPWYGQQQQQVPQGPPSWVPEGEALPPKAIAIGRDFNRAATKVVYSEAEWLDHRIDELRVKL